MKLIGTELLGDQSNKAKTLIICRHALAQKNIDDIHGGEGTRILTPGIDQINGLHAQFRFPANEEIAVYSSPALQAVETANRFAADFDRTAKLTVDHRLTPLDLGVLSGLSRAVGRQRYPSESYELDRWRKGEVEFPNLRITGMEDGNLFYSRGLSFTKTILSGPASAVVFATRSTCILLFHILSGNSMEVGGGYKNVEFENCGYAAFELNDPPIEVDRRGVVTELGTEPATGS